MQVIHVRERKKGMEGSVNGCGNTVFAERRQRVVMHHLIFVRFSAIELLELFDAVQIE